MSAPARAAMSPAAPPSALTPVRPGHTPAAPIDSVTVRGITVTLADVARVAPILTFHPQERHHPCSIEALLAHACLKGAQGEVLVDNPTPADLGRHRDSKNRVWLHASHAAGAPAPADGRITAPMYVVVQVPENKAYVDIRYMLLFAYQGAQVVRVMVPGPDFNTFLPHFGEHQGDIESVCVRLAPDLKTITHVTFEQHGHPNTQPANHVMFCEGHPVARCALEDHATYNAQGLADDACIEHAAETRKPILGFGVAFIDLVSKHGARWAPHEARGEDRPPFIFVGLDASGEPIHHQTWAAYAGSIGGSWRTEFAGAQGIGKPLSWGQRTYVNGVVHAVVASGKLDAGRRASQGTPGLGGRSWIRMAP